MLEYPLVVPTHVGVNRAKELEAAARAGCPHARGGEPDGDRTPWRVERCPLMQAKLLCNADICSGSFQARFRGGRPMARYIIRATEGVLGEARRSAAAPCAVPSKRDEATLLAWLRAP